MDLTRRPIDATRDLITKTDKMDQSERIGIALGRKMAKLATKGGHYLQTNRTSFIKIAIIELLKREAPHLIDEWLMAFKKSVTDRPLNDKPSDDEQVF